MPQPQRAPRQPPLVHVHRGGRSDGDLTDRQIEGSIRPSIHPSDQQPKRLSYSHARLARWLERYVAVAARHAPGGNMHDTPDYAPRFHNARLFVRRFGTSLILEALHEMMIINEVPVGDRIYLDRLWRPEIVSPARYLNWSVGQLAELARQEREEAPCPAPH